MTNQRWKSNPTFHLLQLFWMSRPSSATELLLQQYHELMSFLCHARNPACPGVDSLDSRARAPPVGRVPPGSSPAPPPITRGEEEEEEEGVTVPAGCRGRRQLCPAAPTGKRKVR